MSAPRIAIAAPRQDAWSETFIAAHMQRLRGVERILVDGELPNRVVNGPLLLHRHGPGRIMDHVLAMAMGTDTQGLLRGRIARLLRKERIDVLLAEYGTCAAALAGPCHKAGVALVAHFHGVDAHKASTIEAAGGYRDLFARAAALVVVSRAMEAQLIALGAPKDKVIYNCYGIDATRFVAGDPEQAPPHFIAVGRFVDKKAPHLTMGAFKRVLAVVPDARLTMAGQGPLWESCVQRVKAEGLGEHIDLCGLKGPDEIAGLMRGSRAFVQHSVRALSGDSEGTPLAVLEAMATGLPVVATRHTGIGDVVAHGVNGLLCEEFDVATMAANLIALAKEPARAGEMGRAGRAAVLEKHRVEDSISRLQAVLEKAAGAR